MPHALLPLCKCADDLRLLHEAVTAAWVAAHRDKPDGLRARRLEELSRRLTALRQ